MAEKLKCESCLYKTIADGGYCYMWEKEPAMCGYFKPKAGAQCDLTGIWCSVCRDSHICTKRKY